MRRPSRERGFTLLEVMIAIGILSMSLTSLLSSQMASMRATRYARGVTAAAFLAEHQLIELEWQSKLDGWTDSDQTFEGDFGDDGWPDIRYECLVDFIELPDYSELAQAVDAAENDTDGRTGTMTQDAGEQAFGVLGMVWPVVKGAIEASIRKAQCTVYWEDGNIEHDFLVSTFWTDIQRLQMLPQLGGETTDADDTSSDDDASSGGASPGGSSGTPSGRGGVRGGGAGGGGPGLPPSMGGGGGG